MIKTPVVVKTEDGFDGRPIALLVQEASQYASKVYIQVGEKINVVTDGEDERKAAEGIRTFFANKVK